MGRLLISKTSAFGDLVQTFYVVEDIVRRRPDLDIYWCVDSRFVLLASLHPAIRGVIALPTRSWRGKFLKWTTWHSIYRWISEIRRLQIDIALDLQGMYKSAFVCWASRAPIRIGRTRSSSVEGLSFLCFTRRIDASGRHGVAGGLRYLSSVALNYSLEGLSLSSGIQKKMVKKKRIVLIIGASRPEKTWPFNLWTELSKRLLSDSVFKEFQVIVIWGTQQERERAVALAEHHSRIRPHDILMSPPNLASFLSESSLVIGTDSGPTHLAATVGAQTLMLFGVTAPEQNSSSEVENLIPLGSVNAWPTVTEVFDKASLQCTSKADFSVSNYRLTTRNDTE